MTAAVAKSLPESRTITVADTALNAAELSTNSVAALKGDELTGVESLLLLSALATLVASVMTFVVF